MVGPSAGRTDGEAGNRTSYSPVGARTRAELGKNTSDTVKLIRFEMLSPLNGFD